MSRGGHTKKHNRCGASAHVGSVGKMQTGKRTREIEVPTTPDAHLYAGTATGADV
jgi:hypothetical protein